MRRSGAAQSRMGHSRTACASSPNSVRRHAAVCRPRWPGALRLAGACRATSSTPLASRRCAGSPCGRAPTMPIRRWACSSCRAIRRATVRRSGSSRAGTIWACASGSHEVVFDGLALPPAHAVDLRAPADWLARPDPDQQAWMIVLLGALYDSVARAARSWLVTFLAERTPSSLGATLSTVPRIQQTLGEIDALLWANQAMLDALTLAADSGAPPSPIDSGLAKFNVTGNAIRAVELALQGHRQPRPVAPQSARAPLARRPVQPHPHAAERQHPGGRGEGGLRDAGMTTGAACPAAGTATTRRQDDVPPTRR